MEHTNIGAGNVRFNVNDGKVKPPPPSEPPVVEVGSGGHCHVEMITIMIGNVVVMVRWLM